MSLPQDNNIRYVALNTLARVVGVDTQAVQRHRATVVQCVKVSTPMAHLSEHSPGSTTDLPAPEWSQCHGGVVSNISVVACLRQDADVSIRRRALDLVLALVNEDNIQALTTELLDYLKVSQLMICPLCWLAPLLSPIICPGPLVRGLAGGPMYTSVPHASWDTAFCVAHSGTQHQHRQ